MRDWDNFCNMFHVELSGRDTSTNCMQDVLKGVLWSYSLARGEGGKLVKVARSIL